MENFFKNKTFVFTGDLTLERDYAKSKVILLGGRVTTQPSRKTDYLVVGAEPGPKKLKKAKDLKIEIIYEREFTRHLEEANIEDKGMTKEEFEISSDFDDNSVFDTIEDHVPSKKLENHVPSKNQDLSMWSEKYRPKKRSDLVGNPGVLTSLADFLKGQTKYKGALLSGSPGLGKTTSVHVLCKELGLDLIEFNASDVRNKSLIIKKIKGLVNTKGLTKDMKLKDKVILMDEVDGMTSDRGGLIELNLLIKNSDIPIVCICNDRNNLKMRTLGNNCLDLKFQKLTGTQILPRIKKILKEEGESIGDNILNDIIFNSNGDIRYILNTLQRISSFMNIEIISDLTRKTISKNIFEIAKDCFHRKSINEKTHLYFEDYSIIPLFISENYMKLSYKNLKDFYESAESLSTGDVVEKLIRGSTQEWSLAPLHGFFTVALPTRDKIINKRIDFPSWLGQNSRYQKFLRNIKEIKLHSSRIVKTGIDSFRKYESNIIYLELITLLKNEKVKEALDILVEYDLIKDDFINLSEILIDGQALYKEIKTKTKGDFTRQYNKLKRQLPYAVEEVKKKKGKVEEEEEEEEEEMY